MKSQLQQLWLKENEAILYLALLKLGTTYASQLVKDTGLANSSVYNALEYLERRGLVNKYIHGRTTKFSAEDPSKLEYLATQELKSAKENKDLASSIVPELYGMKNPHLSLPTVRMYQGDEGLRTVLEDSLGATEEVYTYVSPVDMIEHMSEINDEYVKKRIKAKIIKKTLMLDTPENRKIADSYIGKSVSEVRFVPKELTPFHTDVNIYDGKITYITYRQKNPIGIIIEDEDIYQVHRSMFEGLWWSCA